MAKKALVVGINAYPPPNTLPSCINDANAFSDLLRSAYQYDTIIDLRDAQASRAAMLDALTAFVAGAGANDELVFYYSGHGYTFQQGDAQVDSLVGQDCQFLTVDDFAAATASVPAGRLTVVLDSCFSGGMQKAFAQFAGVKPVKTKFFVPTEIAAQAKAFDPALPAIRVVRHFGSPAVGSDPSILLSLTHAEKAFSVVDPSGGDNRRFLLMSACQRNETAAASTDRTSGMSAFTFCLLRQIATDGRTVGTVQLVDEAGQALRGLGVTQTPTIMAPSSPAALIQHAFLLWDTPVPELQSLPQPALAANARTANPTAKGFTMTPIDYTSDIRGIVLATSPAVAASLNGASSKGFDPSASNGIDKGWFDDLTRVVATVIPAVVQGMKSMDPPTKGFDAAPQPFDKGWFDNLVAVATAVVPQIVVSLKTIQPGTGAPNAELVAAAQKGWFDDVTHVVANVLPIVLSAVKSMPPGSATKGFDPLSITRSPQPIDDKSFWSTLGNIASVAVPIVLAAI